MPKMLVFKCVSPVPSSGSIFVLVHLSWPPHLHHRFHITIIVHQTSFSIKTFKFEMVIQMLQQNFIWTDTAQTDRARRRHRDTQHIQPSSQLSFGWRLWTRSCSRAVCMLAWLGWHVIPWVASSYFTALK